MKAVRIHQFGGPEVLTYEDVPDPQPRKDHVLVRVRACALNHLDIWVRKGLPGVKLPHILGSDVAGEVVEAGEYVGGFKTGQRVLLAPMHYCGHCEKCVAGLQNQCRAFTVLGNGVDGGDCELIAVPAANVIPIPDSLDFNQAASVPLVFVTAWHMLVGRAGIRPGQTVLVLGASSGVGIAAIQMAKDAGARVLATASSAERLERLREYGLDEGINYREDDFALRVRELTSGQGADVIVDSVGGSNLQKSLLALAYRGRCVSFGDAGREESASLDISSMRGQNQAFTSFFLGAELFLGTRAHAVIETILQDVAADRWRVVIDRTYPLADAEEAHAYIESRQAFGRVLLIP